MGDLMNIWNHGKKTDPSATKENTQGGRTSTSINGYWIVQKATELWGPIGKNWGYEILEDTFTDGIPIVGENDETLCMSQMHTIKLRLYYPESGPHGVISFGHTPYVYKSRYGPICDMEAPKKSLTDALKKALSMLGFSADIFLGEWDDKNYIQERLNEEALDKAEDKNKEALRQAIAYDKWLDDHVGLISTATTDNELQKLVNLVVRKCKLKNDEDGSKRAVLAAETRKKTLKEKNNAA